MPLNPHAVARLPLCEIADVFWSEAKTELIEYVTESPFVQRIPTGCVFTTFKSYSAPNPQILGRYDLRITTVVLNCGGERQSFSFPGVTITEIVHQVDPDQKHVWLTRFWTYNLPSYTVAEAGRKGGKKTGRKGFAAMPKEEMERIRAMGRAARRKNLHLTPDPLPLGGFIVPNE